MIDLGVVRLAGVESVREARNKIRELTLELARDSLLATRVATAVSEMARRLLDKEAEAHIEVGIRQTDRFAELEIAFAGANPIPRPDFLAAFFDRVESGTSAEGKHAIRAVSELPAVTTLDDRTVAHLTRVLEQKSRDELMAELQVKNRELLESFENLRRTTSAKERMESELNIGRDIQMSMLPVVFPPYPRRSEFDVFATLEPAREVGGDFYDFFLLDDDHFCVCVGDVSGKGVPAALFMAVTKTLIKSRASNDYSPASILTHVNTEISRNNDASMFVTIFLGIMDLSSGELRYANAGHNPPYVRRANGELVRLDQRHGPVVGALDDLVYGQDSAVLGAGDLLFAYTDGVTEAMNLAQELYDEARLVELLTSCESNHAEEAVRAVLENVRGFQGEAEQADDITIIALTYDGKPHGTEARVLDLVIANRMDEISRANAEFNEFAESEGLEASVRRSTNLVLDELLNNVISYAFADDDDHKIDVKIELSSDRLSVTVADDGVPFNPFAGSPPDTALSVEEREIGGLGIHLVRNVMDEVSYNRRTDSNVVILVKYLDDRSNR